MSTTLALHFPWKRYHATPWGHYVNEGLVEIPPSPWRILRALYATWRLRAPELDADTVHSLLERLAVPPDYMLPPYRLSHTRHYLPDSKHRTGAPSTDLALDAFALLGGDATFYVQWAVDLDPDQEQALKRLAASLPYLGRADSLCEARLEHDWTRPDVPAAVPLLDEDTPDRMIQVGVLAPDFPFGLKALTAETRDVRRAKLVYPPGSRIIQYAVPEPEHASPPPRRRARKAPETEGVTAVRFTLTGKPQPRAVDTVAVTDALRSACLKALAEVLGGPAGRSNLTGKDTDGTPLTGHQHAHYLALGQHGHINELAIWAPGGLTDEEFAALDRLAGRTIGVPKDVRGPRNLHIRISAYGNEGILPTDITGNSCSWVSATPFVLPRWRPRQTSPDEHLLNEITRELQNRGRPAPLKITLLPGNDWVLYRRHRWSPHRRPGQTAQAVGSRDQARPTFGLRLDFDREVKGPLALGHLSHFGLGLFHTTES